MKKTIMEENIFIAAGKSEVNGEDEWDDIIKSGLNNLFSSNLSLGKILDDKEYKIGAVIGTSLGNIENVYTDFYNNTKQILKYYITRLRIEECFFVSETCLSGLKALEFGIKMLENHIWDIAVIGGIDIKSDYITAGLNNIQLLSTDEFCCPFGTKSKGMVIASGSAFLVLMNKNSYKRSDSISYGHIMSVCVTNGGLESRRETSLREVVQLALKKANWKADDIDVICSTADGTDVIDSALGEILYSVFNQNFVYNIKSAVKHTLGASYIYFIVAILKNDLSLREYEIKEKYKKIKLISQQELKRAKSFILFGISMPYIAGAAIFVRKMRNPETF